MRELVCSASRGCPMPQSIPAGLTRTHVLQALADLDAGVDHPFGQPTGYELLHEGKRYPPKAVVGLACRYSLGRVLLPEEFSGGEAPGQANFVLRKLGFTVFRKGESEPSQDTDAARDWTDQEVRLIVADYLAMLEAELQGEPYKKSEHHKALISLLAGRSDGSVEFKHQNISSLLVEFGLPYVEGYKPRGNYQGLLATEVESFLDQRPGFLEQLAASPTLNPSTIKQPHPWTSARSLSGHQRRSLLPVARISPGCLSGGRGSTSPRRMPPTEVLASSERSSFTIW